MSSKTSEIDNCDTEENIGHEQGRGAHVYDPVFVVSTETEGQGRR